MGFYEWLADNSVYGWTEPERLLGFAIDGQLGTSANKYANDSDLSSSGGPYSLENLETAIQTMELTNELRVQNGLQPLEVDSYCLAMSSISVFWASHYGNDPEVTKDPHKIAAESNLGENLAWGSSNAEGAIRQWYYNEKQYWESSECDAIRNAYESWSGSDSEKLSKLLQEYGNEAQRVGHYLSIINEDYVFFGSACVRGGNYNGNVSSTTFELSFSPWQRADAMKLTTFRAFFDEFKKDIDYQPAKDPDDGVDGGSDGPSSSVSFKDVNASTFHVDDVLWLASEGISTGFPDGTFRPMENVARCDMAAFLYRVAGEPYYEVTAEDLAAFSDVDLSTPHIKEVCWLASEGVSTGFPDGTFRPYANIARCDMAAFLQRLGRLMGAPGPGMGPLFKDVESGTPHADAIEWLAGAGITTGFSDGTFRPYDNIVRCDMAAFLHRLSNYVGK